MIHEVLPVGQLGCNCSILGDPETAEAIVVDPGDDISEIEAILSKHGLMVKMILITHAHIDHIGGAAKLKESTGAPVYMNENDSELYKHLDMQAAWLRMRTPEKTQLDGNLKDGDRLLMGTTELLAMHTPGHTQGSSCIWIPSEKTLLAGDTLFRDSIGRTDLPGGDGKQILRSISNKLLELPEDTVVIAGHGDATTIGREKKRNPFLRGL
ncbi:MAG TPA: MBL fold metallo-hydrolase [Bryobacteraceae bacterium]|nr:MBL fold metallo-hydrolase [Bryobacteraceae bacterium]